MKTNVTITMKIDVPLLKEQKIALIDDIENGWGIHKEYLTGILHILDAITDQIPDKVYDKVEEDQSPYVPIPAQFGRPFTIRHCVNCGQRLMVDPLDFLLNIDKDVLCDACKNPKKYEKEEKAIRL